MTTDINNLLEKIKKCEIQKEKARLRQKKYYNNHKEKINLNRRKVVEKIIPEIIPEKEPEIIPEKEQELLKELSYELAVEKLKELSNKTESSTKKYIEDLKRIIKITNCQNLLDCFKNASKFTKEIINFKQNKNDKNYGVNTIKGMIQTILYLITNLNLNLKKETIDYYKDIFEEYKLLSIQLSEAKKSIVNDLTFDEYLEKVKTKFGENSKQYLVALLYSELTVRDNFGKILIIKSIRDATNKDFNYILLPKSTQARVIINVYKTSKKYGQIDKLFTETTTKLIRNYISKNQIEYGDVLFKDTNLSSFVSKINKKIGLKGSITTLRSLKVTDNSLLTAKERVQISKEMGHSVLTAEKVYKNKRSKK